MSLLLQHPTCQHVWRLSGAEVSCVYNEHLNTEKRKGNRGESRTGRTSETTACSKNNSQYAHPVQLQVFEFSSWRFVLLLSLQRLECLIVSDVITMIQHVRPTNNAVVFVL